MPKYNAIANSLSKMVEVQTQAPPNGSYSGTMSGYSVQFEFGGSTYKFNADGGVRGLNCPCTVTIHDGEITVNI